MTTFRKGDVCTIQVAIDSVIFEANGIKCIRVKIDGEFVYVDPAALKMVRTQFEVGDRVGWKSAGDYYRGEVLAISGEHLWIDRGEGNYATVWTGLATRLDPDPDFDEIADDPSSPIPDLEPRVPRFDDGEDRSVEAE